MFVGGKEDEKYKMSRLTFNPKGFKIELKKKTCTLIRTCICEHVIFLFMHSLVDSQ